MDAPEAPEVTPVDTESEAQAAESGQEAEAEVEVVHVGNKSPGNYDEKMRKLNSEAKGLRERLKEYEAAAQEAERAKMSELERERAEKVELQAQLAQRDTQLLATRYGIPEEFIEFIGEGTFEEKEARAAKVGEMTQQKTDPTPAEKPPSVRPVESLTPGASPSSPPVKDTSYPASWGYQPPST